jgi:inhibitor of cysteine peptidase
LGDIEIRENGANITANQGDRILIRIPENPTTGYRWAPGDIAEELELESNEFTPPEELRPGAGGERVIALRATRPGSSHAEFVLARPWEDREPADRWRVTVTVT